MPGVASWESKYYYQVWRPVTGIREADPGTGPDRAWRRQPADDRRSLNSRRSARPRATFRGRTSRRRFPPTRLATRCLVAPSSRRFGTSTAPTTSRSRSRPTSSTASHGGQRGQRPSAACRARFRTLSQAEEENGQSRIYLGIHWAFDKTEGIAQGRRIANYVFANAFRRR